MADLLMKTAILILASLLFALPATAHAQRPLAIKLVDCSTPYVSANAEWTSADYAFAQAALQNQANAVASIYHKAGIVVYGFGRHQGQPAGAWPIYVRNVCTFPGGSAAAFHWTANGKPYGCVASNGGGGAWWMTRGMEHEMAEMAGDPSGTGREIVDPVARYFGEVVNGTFTFDYTDFAGYPFVDFLLTRKAAKASGFKDYLHQLVRPSAVRRPR